MTSSTNNNSSWNETFDPLYEVLLYKKKDIIAIQEKLGISGNANRMANIKARRRKTLADSYELLLDLTEDIILIQRGLGINVNPILEAMLRSNKAHETSADISYGEIFNLLLCLEDDIVTIQEELDIIGYSNQERAEEVDENIRAHLKKLEESHGPLEDDPCVILLKYGEMEIEKIRFTEEQGAYAISKSYSSTIARNIHQKSI